MRALLAAVALLLAGCQSAPVPHEESARIEPEAFDRAGAPWVAALSSGCGFCGPEAQHHWTLVVFGNARVALFWWSSDPHRGEVTYDEGERRTVVEETGGRTADDAPRYVYTARLRDEDLPARLQADWTTSTTKFGCTDFGATYAVRHENGTTERQQTTCLDEGDPFVVFSEPLWTLYGEMQTNATRQG